MLALIDCGTTYTRLYIVDNDEKVIAEGKKKVGVRDTSITGSRHKLRDGICELFQTVLRENCLSVGDISCAVASGMITSEIGLIEIPHLVAPVSEKDLADNIYVCNDADVIPLGVPVVFIRGIRNDYGDNVRLDSIRKVDFLRGEEVQCIGIANSGITELPVNVVVLSSHTKLIHINEKKQICACMTTLSGQLFDVLISGTSVGKSLIDCEGEEPGGYTREEIFKIASECVQEAGIVRTLLMPRFMQVLLQTDCEERRMFADAAIATDDMKAFDEFERLGFGCRNYLLFGHKSRCHLYEYLIRQRHADAGITSISDDKHLADTTVSGILSIVKTAGIQIN